MNNRFVKLIAATRFARAQSAKYCAFGRIEHEMNGENVLIEKKEEKKNAFFM